MPIKYYVFNHYESSINIKFYVIKSLKIYLDVFRFSSISVSEDILLRRRNNKSIPAIHVPVKTKKTVVRVPSSITTSPLNAK